MLFNIVIASLLGVCTLAAPLDAGPAETGNISGAVKAIEAGPLEPGVTSWGTSSIINELSGRESKSSGLQSRQRFCQFKDEINGNGNPTYRVLHKQLSQTLTCSQTPGCSVGQTETISYTVSANLGGAASWISAGFGVSKSYATGNSYTCPGASNSNVCIWTEIEHTDYDVMTCGTTGGACGKDCGAYRRISSPNSYQKSPHYYCVEGDDCRTQGDEYWVDA